MEEQMTTTPLPPAPERLRRDPIEQAGIDACLAGIAATECPYCFIKTECYPNNFAAFESKYRAKLELWMRGWIAEKKQNIEEPKP